jgi:3-oxoadipate enol-lactonase
MWYNQIPVFSKKYRTIVYDVRGSGKTESPQGDYSMSLFVEDLESLMKAINVEKAFFLGFSMGGRIALNLAIKHPEMVKALIMANSPAISRPPSSESPKRPPIDIEPLKQGNIEQFAEIMTESALSPGFKSRNPSAFKKYVEVKAQNRPEGLVRLMKTLGVMASSPDLSKIKCPVLFITGEKDPLISIEQCEQAQQAVPGSQLVIMPTGHASAIEMPDEFNSAVLEFLTRIKKT